MKFNFFKQRKAAKNYSINMMPTTRKQVFRDILHLHTARIFYIGLMFLAFSLPLHLLDLFEDIYITSIGSNVNGEMTQTEINEVAYSVISIKNMFALIKIPLWIIFSIGFAGILRIVRQYCWIENVSLKHDFLIGIKQNFKQSILTALLLSVTNFVCTYLINTSYVVGDSSYSAILFLPMALNFLIIIPMILIVCVSIPIYSNTFIQNVKIALALMMKKYSIILLSSVVLVLPFMMISELGFYPNLIIRLIYSIFGGFIMIGYCLFIYNLMDKHINSKYFPDLVGRGTIWNEDD